MSVSAATAGAAVPPATPPASPQPGASTGWFNAVLAGIDHGAALVYHEVVQIEQDAAKWKTDNPEVAPLIEYGLSATNSYLTRLGVPVDAVTLIGTDILAALKALAAADTSVPSTTATIAEAKAA